MCCRATRSTSKATRSSGRAAAAAAADLGQPRWRRRGRFPLRAVARGVHRPVPRRSRASRPRQEARSRRSRANNGAAPATWLQDPRPISAAAHDAELAVAAHCAERPRLDELEELRAQIAELEESGDNEVQLAWLRNKLGGLERRDADGFPISTRSISATAASNASEADRTSRHVLPDGRLGIDDRAEKDLAKRFFMLLHLFLSRRYRHVEVVSSGTRTRRRRLTRRLLPRPETGGTLVSSALEEMRRVVTERYQPEDEHLCRAGVGRRQFQRPMRRAARAAR